MIALIITIFILGYIAIATEHSLKINKAQRGAGPRGILLAFRQGGTDGVQAGDKLALVPQGFHHLLPNTSHNVHVRSYNFV